MNRYNVTEIDLYLCEVGDGVPEWQLSQQQQNVLNQRCLGKWTAKDEFFSYYFNKNNKFDLEHHNTWVTRELTVLKTYKEKVQKFLNDEPAVRALFGLDCNTRDDFKAKVWNS